MKLKQSHISLEISRFISHYFSCYYNGLLRSLIRGVERLKRKQKLLFGSSLFAVLFILIPISVAAIEGSIPVPASSYAQITLSDNGSSGSFTASPGEVTAFITDDSGHGGSPPFDALWSTTGFSGSWDVTFPDSGPWYLVFSNLNGFPVQVEYQMTSGIPGFELIYAIFVLLAIVGIFALKKKSIL